MECGYTVKQCITVYCYNYIPSILLNVLYMLLSHVLCRWTKGVYRQEEIFSQHQPLTPGPKPNIELFIFKNLF